MKKVTLIHIKNMVCQCCKGLLTEKLEEHGFKVHDMLLGKAKISFDPKKSSLADLKALLQKYGFDLLESKEDKLVSEIKVAVIELVHHLNNVNSIVRKSDYMVEKLGYGYQHLSKVFSEQEGITLEKYTILQKIERIKHLIEEDEYSLSEIAYMMDYSSVQYLSNQFKKVTGITVSEYKSNTNLEARAIDSI